MSTASQQTILTLEQVVKALPVGTNLRFPIDVGNA
jgi:hypothetical protein